MEHLWSPAGATGGNRWQMGRAQKPLKQADPQPVATHDKVPQRMGRRGSTVRVRQRACKTPARRRVRVQNDLLLTRRAVGMEPFMELSRFGPGSVAWSV